MEKKLRAKLEDELKDLRQEKESGTNNGNDGDIDIEQVMRKLSAGEEKVKTTTILFDINENHPFDRLFALNQSVLSGNRGT